MGKPIPELTDEELTKRLVDIEDGLTDWEVQFCESIRQQVKQGRVLTEKQRKRAEAIAEEKT